MFRQALELVRVHHWSRIEPVPREKLRDEDLSQSVLLRLRAHFQEMRQLRAKGPIAGP